MGLTGGKVVVTPLEQNLKLTSVNYDKAMQVIVFDSYETRYSFAVQHLSEFMQRPKRSHYEAALRIVEVCFFPTNGSLRLVAYCDSDWASCPMSRKSVTGFCVKMGDPIPYQDRQLRQGYRSMTLTVSEIVWLSGLLDEIGFKSKESAILFCDNKAAIQIANNHFFHERTKHIEIDCHF
ncbi:hypothetical protein EPI10_024984 [Gossypium australe]|uniref:Uncharacterized protein n=1 Tax=Gossypium australe TaxID=47621 RepID=A0A5B6VZ37_9ROSI|nr:hypothetical protein EPI10_024984 [Gossypium australe]